MGGRMMATRIYKEWRTAVASRGGATPSPRYAAVRIGPDLFGRGRAARRALDLRLSANRVELLGSLDPGAGPEPQEWLGRGHVAQVESRERLRAGRDRR